MKIPRLEDILWWRNKLHKVIGLSDQPTVLLESLDHKRCPHCDGYLGPDQVTLIITAPIFQQEAEPVQTLIDNSSKSAAL